jgi:hypothetical protein
MISHKKHEKTLKHSFMFNNSGKQLVMTGSPRLCREFSLCPFVFFVANETAL